MDAKGSIKGRGRMVREGGWSASCVGVKEETARLRFFLVLCLYSTLARVPGRPTTRVVPPRLGTRYSSNARSSVKQLGRPGAIAAYMYFRDPPFSRLAASTYYSCLLQHIIIIIIISYFSRYSREYSASARTTSRGGWWWYWVLRCTYGGRRGYEPLLRG